MKQLPARADDEPCAAHWLLTMVLTQWTKRTSYWEQILSAEDQEQHLSIRTGRYGAVVEKISVNVITVFLQTTVSWTELLPCRLRKPETWECYDRAHLYSEEAQWAGLVRGLAHKLSYFYYINSCKCYVWNQAIRIFMLPGSPRSRNPKP
jgi:hypothetical protein